MSELNKATIDTVKALICVIFFLFEKLHSLRWGLLFLASGCVTSHISSVDEALSHDLKPRIYHHACSFCFFIHNGCLSLMMRAHLCFRAFVHKWSLTGEFAIMSMNAHFIVSTNTSVFRTQTLSNFLYKILKCCFACESGNC